MADTDILVEIDNVTKTALRPPSKFNVVLYNDDTTTMEFVILVLMSIFHKNFEDASDLCLNIHEHGKGIAGTFGLEVASQKRHETISAARANNFPLKCELEEVTN